MTVKIAKFILKIKFSNQIFLLHTVCPAPAAASAAVASPPCPQKAWLAKSTDGIAILAAPGIMMQS